MRPVDASSLPRRRDVFLSHASEDKPFVRRLAKGLHARGISTWLDEADLSIGDSLSHVIDGALASSRYAVVILSPHFLAKPWPKRELRGLEARALATGEKVLLPVWHGVTSQDIVAFSPPLADLLAINSSAGMEAIIDQIARTVRPEIRDTHRAAPRQKAVRPPVELSGDPADSPDDRLDEYNRPTRSTTDDGLPARRLGWPLNFDVQAALDFAHAIPPGTWSHCRDVAAAGGAPEAEELVRAWMEAMPVPRVLGRHGRVPSARSDSANRETLRRWGIPFDSSGRAIPHERVAPLQSGPRQASHGGDNAVLVFAATHADYERYLTSSTVVLPAGTKLRDVARMAFFYKGHMQIYIPSVLGRAETLITKSNARRLARSSRHYDRAAGEAVNWLASHDEMIGESRVVFSVTSKDDYRTLMLTAPYRPPGGRKWLQERRYVDLSVLYSHEDFRRHLREHGNGLAHDDRGSAHSGGH